MSFDSDFKILAERVGSMEIEMRDISNDLEIKAQDFEYNAERHQFVEERLMEIHRLQNKHLLTDANDLLETKTQIEEQLMKVTTSDEELVQLEDQLAQLEEKLKVKADQLKKRRIGVLKLFQEKVEITLNSLGIPYARLVIDHCNLKEFNLYGTDKFEFLFSANKGVAPTKVAKTASGGETSRLMLALKEIMAQHKQLPTILFDEIDTGVSGEIAEKMGGILSEMGKQRQVISITHLPQLAAKGTHHFYVHKLNDAERSVTKIKELSEEERVSELAKMLSGSVLTEAAMNNAKELLHH